MEDNDALYILNTTTGVASYRTSPPDFAVSENSPTGLASHGGVLYMLGFVNKALFTLNVSTGRGDTGREFLTVRCE